MKPDVGFLLRRYQGLVQQLACSGWIRHPYGTAHSFVLAHATCNHDKRDMLAALLLLARWLRPASSPTRKAPGWGPVGPTGRRRQPGPWAG